MITQYWMKLPIPHYGDMMACNGLAENIVPWFLIPGSATSSPTPFIKDRGPVRFQ